MEIYDRSEWERMLLEWLENAPRMAPLIAEIANRGLINTVPHKYDGWFFGDEHPYAVSVMDEHVKGDCAYYILNENGLFVCQNYKEPEMTITEFLDYIKRHMPNIIG